MKSILTLLLLIPFFLFGQHVELADHITPEDLGGHKWILKATGGAEEVVIFRITTTKERNENTTVEVYDTVRYFPEKEQRGTALFFDPEYFVLTDSGDRQWFFRALGSSGWITGNYKYSSTRANLAKIGFYSETQGSTEKQFEVLVVPYAEAKGIHPELPKMNPDGGWGWAGYPKQKREPVDGGQ